MGASQKKWMGVTLVATLVLGMGVGIIADRFVLARTSVVHSRAGDADRRGSGDHEDRGRRMVERLRSGLDLTDEQATRLEEIINKNHDTAHEFWKNSRQEYETLRRQFRSDIRGLLTEDQKVKFDDMVAEYESRHRDREGRRGEQ
jgi:Spy/CpxP family protein refolding chaperone